MSGRKSDAGRRSQEPTRASQTIRTAELGATSSALDLVVDVRRRLGDNQHLFESSKFDRRRDRHAKEQSRTFAMHILNRPDQQPARENSVESRSDDGVAGADVLGAIGVFQNQAVIDQPRDYSACARALIEAVERRVVIVDKQYSRRMRTDRAYL